MTREETIGGGPGGDVGVTVNGEARSIPDGRSVREMLLDLRLQPALVVVERNGEILHRERYGEVEVEAGDVYEIVHFVGGGADGTEGGAR